MFLKNFLVLALPAFLCANPNGGTVIRGDCEIHPNDKLLTVLQNTDRAIIHWGDFSISERETVRFSQPSETAAILNRVIGGNPSLIYGALEANGQVFLINQNGVLIGPSGLIHTQGFVASALNVADGEFIEGKEFHFHEGSGMVSNLGTIDCNGNIFLLGQEVENCGSLFSKEGKVFLLAGSEALWITQENDPVAIRVKGEGIISNCGLIEAVQAELRAAGGDLSSLAIQQNGIVRAKGIVKKEGRILLDGGEGLIQVTGHLEAKSEDKGGIVHVLGGYVQLLDEAQIDVSGDFGGGEALIGGDYKGSNPEIPNATACFVGEKVKIDGSAHIEGDGGKLIFWGTSLNYFFGTASATGGAQAGDGGFVEISSLGDLDPRGLVHTSAPNGQTGILLLDPIILTIGGGVNSGFTGFVSPPQTINFNNGAATAAITAATLVAQLNGPNNVFIDTSFPSGTGPNGNVTINGAISWSAATMLQIKSPNNITVAAAVSNTNNAGVNFTAIDFQANLAGGSTQNNNGIIVSSPISSVNGNIMLQGTAGSAGVGVTGVGLVSATGTISSTGVGAAAADILISGNSGTGSGNNAGVNIGNATSISSVDGDIFLTGVFNSGGTAGQGILTSGTSTIRCTGTGSIFMDGTVNTGVTTNLNGIVISGTANGTTQNIQTASGGIFLTGNNKRGRGTAGSGINITGSGLVTTTGMININGTILDTVAVQILTNSFIRSTSGAINIAGNLTTPTGPAIIIGGGAPNVIGGPSNAGPITLLGQPAFSLGGNTFQGTSASVLTFLPASANQSIGIGPGLSADYLLNTILLAASGFGQTVVGATNQASTTTIANITPPTPLVLNNRNVVVNSGLNMDTKNFTANISTGGGAGALILNSSFIGAATNTVNGTGAPQNNTFKALFDPPNVWFITSDNAGTFTSESGLVVHFNNVGSLTGFGNDTFIFADGTSLAGQIDGGLPASGNTLNYTLWTTDPHIVPVSSTSGNASNLNTSGAFNLGYINIGHILPSPASTSPFSTQMTLTDSFFFLYPSIDLADALFQKWLFAMYDCYYLHGKQFGLVNYSQVVYSPNGHASIVPLRNCPRPFDPFDYIRYDENY